MYPGSHTREQPPGGDNGEQSSTFSSFVSTALNVVQSVAANSNTSMSNTTSVTVNGWGPARTTTGDTSTLSFEHPHGNQLSRRNNGNVSDPNDFRVQACDMYSSTGTGISDDRNPTGMKQQQKLLGWTTKEEAFNGMESPKTTGGTRIPKTEHRGITVRQLRDIVQQIRVRCRKEGWTSTNPGLAGQQLFPEDVTLYDLVKHFVMPVTTDQQCSYVETVAENEQKPQWFVSHWWGESVINFVTCIERHADDRALPDTTVYWVCAYAINQHEVAGELGSDPRESPFYKAMELTEGTVSVLDRDSVTYTRIWCSFEVYLALRDFAFRTEQEGEKRYLYDVYVLVKDKDKSVGLTDGVVPDDQIWRRPSHHNGKHWVWQDYHDETEWQSRKANREEEFPEATCIRALGIQLEEAEASRLEDKKRILNCMTGNLNDLDGEPPDSHPIYYEVNALLRAKFAISSYRRILEGGNTNTLERVRWVLATSPVLRVELSFKGCLQFRDEAIHFLRCLPECLTTLDLDYSMIGFESSREFCVGMSRLSRLESLSLQCKYCPELSCLDDVWRELGLLQNLKQLRLQMFPHKDLASLNEFTEAIVKLPNLESLELSFENSAGANVLGKAVGGGLGAVNLLRRANDSTRGGLSKALSNVEKSSIGKFVSNFGGRPGKVASGALSVVNAARITADFADTTDGNELFSGLLGPVARSSKTSGCPFSERTLLKLLAALNSMQSIKRLSLNVPGPLSKPLKKVKTRQDLEETLKSFANASW